MQKLLESPSSGCIRNIHVQSLGPTIPGGSLQRYGFRAHLLASNRIQPDCLWEFPCSHNPCIEGARCKERGFDQFDCTCTQTQSTTKNETGPRHDISTNRMNSMAIDDKSTSTGRTDSGEQNCIKPEFYMQQKLKSQFSIDDVIKTEPLYVLEGIHFL